MLKTYLKRATNAARGESGPAIARPESTNEKNIDGSTDHAKSISGSFDGLDGIYVTGWARDESDPTVPLALDVLANNRWVASGLAEMFRGDLHDAGIGKGFHAFRIALPVELCNGEPYEIRVRTKEDAIAVTGDAHVFQQSGAIAGRVEGLDGASVVGWVSNLEAPDEILRLDLLIDGERVATTEARQRDERGFRFGLRVPATKTDGHPHVVAVQVQAPFFLVGEIAVLLPAHQTPTAALRQHAAFLSKAALIDGAAARYEALRRQMNFLAASECPLSPENKLNYLRQVAEAHEHVILGFDAAERSESALVPLEFPRVAAPLVSIVIPVHNKVLVTFNCLASLLLAYNRATFEVIVVDDGSIDDTLRLPALIKGVSFLRHDKAQGFVKSCNDGATNARGKYICMLNNDTEVTTGWIDELVHVFDHFSGVGMAGAKLTYSNGKLQEAGGIVWNNGDPWNYGRGGNASDPRFNYTRQVDYLSGACILLPMDLWKELGGFDERFAPAYFEDADLAFRVRERGLKTIYTPFSEIIHFEGISSGTSVTSGMKRFQEVNRPKFKARWSQAFKNNGVIGRDPDLNKDRNVRFRALVIDFTTPQPDRDAGSYAAVQEIRLLQSLGFKVTFLPDNMAYLASATENLQRMGVECAYSPFALCVSELLESRGSEFDLVYVSRYSIAERHIDAIRRFAPQAKILFNNADLHFLRELRTAISSNSREDMSRALKTREDELAVMRKVDLVLSYNETEHAVIISHNLDSTRVARCPWVVEIAENPPGFKERNGISFVGGFSHHPNAEAMDYFVREVMPSMRKRLPNVPLKIYGSNIPDRIKKLAADDILIEGWVADVDTVYANSRVFIAPLRSGAGLKGKVIGAFAHGIPSVLSPVAAEGTGVRDGLEAFIAATPQQWVESIARLYEDPEAWARMHKAARDYAAETYSFAKGQKLMQEALEAVDIYAIPDGSELTHDLRPE